MHGRIQAFHHFTWKERSDQIYLKLLSPMILQAGYHILIQIILAYRISHQVKAARNTLSGIFSIKGFLCFTDGAGLQAADDLVINQLRTGQLQFKIRTLGSQGASCRGHTDMAQLALNLAFQPFFYLFSQRRHLFYIFNLSVYHCPLRMFLFLDGNNFYLILFYNTYHSDKASRSDVQGKYHMICLHLRLFDSSFSHAHPPA